MKYRQATKDMNERYPDATSEEIAREDTCIICREEMQAWATNPANNLQADGTRPQNAIFDERSRPKKLPCGHILHFGCLRSWLERQQNCPTCRQPVITPSRIRIEVNRGNQAPRAPDHNIGHRHHHHHHPEQRHQHIHQQADRGLPAQANGNQARYVRFGPLQLGIAFGRDGGAVAMNRNGMGNPQQAAAQQPDSNANGNIPGPTSYGEQRIQGNEAVSARYTGQAAIQNHINDLEQLLSQELSTLRNNAEQLQTARALQNELLRLQHQSSTLQLQETTNQAGPELQRGFSSPAFFPPPAPPNMFRPMGHHHIHPSFPQTGQANALSAMGTLPLNQAWRAPQGQRPLTSSDSNLPPGFTLPDGWTLLPLQQNNIRVESPQLNSTTSQQIPMPRSATAPPLEPSRDSVQGTRRDAANIPTPRLPTWQEMANQAEAYQRLLRQDNGSSSTRAGHASPNSQSGLGALSNSHDPAQPSPLRQQNSLPPQSSSLPPMPTTRTAASAVSPISTSLESTRRRAWSNTETPTAHIAHDSSAESSGHVNQSSGAIDRDLPSQNTPEEIQNGSVETRDKGKARAATVEDDLGELD